ncbi:MAG: hypothetical protein ACE5G3_08390 [Gammaproteobacteria bacterium]
MTADNTPVENDHARRRSIRRTAITLAVLAFGWYLGFMALRLLWEPIG